MMSFQPALPAGKGILFRETHKLAVLPILAPSPTFTLSHFPLFPLSLPPLSMSRHYSACGREQAHRRFQQGALLQGVGVLRWAPAVATGDRAADGEDPG